MQKTSEQGQGGRGGDRSAIGPGVTIRGDVEGPCDLHLDGRVIGRVAVSGLLVTERAEIEGPVSAEVLDVAGRIAGPVEVGHLHLRASAVVDGDITYTSIQVEAGARFSGRCTFSDTAAKVISFGRSEDARSEAAEELVGMASRLRRAIEPKSA